MENDMVEALHAELDAALRISAPRTWRQAPSTCFHDPRSGYTCEPYHRAWQYLGLLGVTSSMRTDSAFMLDALRELAQCGGRRILVSGTADFAMLAHILYAFKLENTTVQVTVTDRCETPLSANRWYAERHGMTITTVRSDILDFSDDEGFDAICSHSFIAWFAPEMQTRLVRNWHDLLKPGGRIITTKRLRSGPPDVAQRNTEADAIDLRDRLQAAARRHADRHDIDPDEMAAAAYEFAREHYRYPTNSVDTLRNLFESAGLQVIRLDDGALTDPRRDRATGPARGRGGRMRIIAQRGA